MQSVVREAQQSTKGPEQAVIIMTHFGTPLLHHKAADGSCPEYDLPALGRCLASLQHLMEGEDDVCEHMVALLHMGPLQFLVLGPYRAWRLSVAILVQHVSPTVTLKGLQLLHTFTNLFEPIINNLVRKDFDQSAKRLAGTAQDMLQQRASSSSGSCSEDDTSRLFEAFEDQYVLPLLSCSPADYARQLVGPWLRCEHRPRHGLALLDVQGGELIYYCHASVHDDEAELHPQPHWWAGDRRRAIRQAAAKCFPAREGGHAAVRRRDGQEVQGVVLRWASVVRHGPNHALLHRTHMPSFVLVLPYTQRVMASPAAPAPSPPPAAVSLLPLSVAPPALLSLLEPLVSSLANAFLPRPTLAAYAHTGRMPAAVGANELVCQQDRAAAWSASLSPFSPTALPLLSMDSQGGDEDDDNKENGGASGSSSQAGKGGGLVFAPLLLKSMQEDLERLLDMDENDLLLTTTSSRVAAAGTGGSRGEEEDDGAVTHRAVEAAEPAVADPGTAAQEQEQMGGGGGGSGGGGHVRVKARAGVRHSLDQWLLVPAARAVAGIVAAAGGARPTERTRRKVP